MWRSLVIVVVVMLAAAGRAEPNGLDVVSANPDFVKVKTLDTPVTIEGKELRYAGYFYHRVDVLGLDLWRWDRAEVVYGDPEGFDADGTYRWDKTTTHYVELEPDEAAALGLPRGLPWRVWIPPGLLVVLGVLELVAMMRIRPSVATTFAVGGVLAAVTVWFLVVGLVPEVVVPIILAIAHAYLGWETLRLRDDDDARAPTADASAPASASASAQPMAPARAPLPPPPRVETDPFRAPPAPAPIRVEAPRAAHSAPVIVHDPSAKGPTLLR